MKFPVQLAFVAVFVGLCGQAAADVSESSIEELASEAKAAQQSGDYKLAAVKYRAILELRPNFTQARFNLGLMLHLGGEYEEAAANLKQVLREDPNSFASNFMVGVELLRMQQPREAIPFLERARSLKTGDEHAALSLAQAELLADRFDQAYALFAEITRTEPANSEAWYGLGLSSLGQMQLSVEELSRYARDSVYTKALLSGDSVSQTALVYENCSDQGASLPSIACAEHSGKYDEAMALCRQRLSSLPHDAGALYWKVRINRKLADSALTQVGKINPDSAQLHLLLGHILLDQEKLQQAGDEYQKAIQLDPSGIPAHFGLAMAEYQAHKFDDAMVELRQVLAVAPRDSKANYLLGSILTRRQQYREAQAYLIKAEGDASESDIVPIRSLLAKTYGENGDIAHAIRELGLCLPADTDGSYHYRLFLLYKGAGNTQAAQAALRQYSLLRKKSKSRDDELLQK